jgi:gamma-glutamyltranspeptidase/glutathione hydrolase
MLRSGGNAMDGAVTAAAVLAVVEPQSTGIGGDCFVLYCPRGQGEVIAFNGSGKSPAAANVDWYMDRGFAEVPISGPHSVTVPGAIDAWCRLLADHGTKGIDAALAPAIRYAEEGYVVHDRVAFDWARNVDLLAADEHAAGIFLPGGRAPLPGEVHRQPELAATLRTIARLGRVGFYEGEVARDLVSRLRTLGGLHSLEDFAATAGEYVTPIATPYRNHVIHQVPPPNQGLTALIMLNVLSGYELSSLDPLGAERLHLEVEAGKLAFRDRDMLFGDQAQVRVPVNEMLSETHAVQLRAEIDRGRAMTRLPDVELVSSDTVYISVVDRDRNAVSFINSLYDSFGSGVVGPQSGVVLQNRGSSFRVDPAHPNCIAPRKRPMHTIMPGMATEKGRAVMPYGVMGGDYQPFGHVHVLTNLLDFGMDPQQAIDTPRVFWADGVLEVERGVPQEAVAGLRRMGHKVEVAAAPRGGGQLVLIDWEKGTLTGASDPRKDGCALGY